ncbi:DMT family transporter [Streptomyces sp. NPDC002623]
MRAAPLRPLLYISLAATSWGSAGAAAALLYRTSGLSPVAVSCWRFAIGALLLLAGRAFLAPAVGKGRARPIALMATGVLMAVFQTGYLAAVAFAGLSVGTAVALGAGPVFTALGARLVFGERVGRRGALTILLALCGLALLAFGTDARAGGTEPLWGFLYALASAAGSAAINLLTQAEARRGRAGQPYDRALAGFAIGAVCLLVTATPSGALLPADEDVVTSIALLGYLGAIPTALAYALFFSALMAVRATTVSVVMMLEPVAALILGVTLLDERLTLATASGSALLLCAVMLLAKQERDR